MKMENIIKNGDLRVWWIPQVPMKAFHVPVNMIQEAKLILDTLAEYDKFQYENRIKPDYSNAGGLQVYIDEELEPDWYEWENEFGEDIQQTALDN
jgi:hypothetical protein